MMAGVWRDCFRRIAAPGAIGILSSILLAASLAAAGNAPPITPAEVMAQLGFDASLEPALRGGKVLSTGMPEMEETRAELATAAVMLIVKAPLSKVGAAFVSGETFRVNREYLGYKLIAEQPVLDAAARQAFDAIAYTAAESAEIKKLRGVKAGSTFNLSADEIATMQALPSSATDRDVTAAYAGLLRARYGAYVERGLDGVEPYTRGGKTLVSPRKELTIATASMKLLDRHFPSFYASLLAFPKPAADDPSAIEHRLFWIKQNLQKRPALLLSHHMAERREDYAIIAEQQFYVGSSYNSMEVVIGCVPDGSHTLVFYTNRTFTDQVTGMGSALKHKIGRQKIEETVSRQFTNMRTALEGAGG